MREKLPPDLRHTRDPSLLHQVIQYCFDLVFYRRALLFYNNNILDFLGELADDFRLKRIGNCRFQNRELFI